VRLVLYFVGLVVSHLARLALEMTRCFERMLSFCLFFIRSSVMISE